ncbi:hypothetical protein ACLOJK_020405 [Asimina triloba]
MGFYGKDPVNQIEGGATTVAFHAETLVDEVTLFEEVESSHACTLCGMKVISNFVQMVLELFTWALSGMGNSHLEASDLCNIVKTLCNVYVVVSRKSPGPYIW